MKHNIKFLSFVLLFTISISSFSQDVDDLRDFETWSSIGIEIKSGKWKFELEEQLRLKYNSSIVDQNFTQIEAGYELFSNFQLKTGVRLIRNNDTKGKLQGYENLLRLQLDASYKQEISRLDLSLRLRYQNKNELGISALAGDYPSQHMRLKSSVKYNIKNWKFDPKLSAEIFHHFQAGEENKFNRYRIAAGTTFKIWNMGELGIYYLLEKEINTFNPHTVNILRLKYIHSL